LSYAGHDLVFIHMILQSRMSSSSVRFHGQFNERS
jgi:hypothetical protein